MPFSCKGPNHELWSLPSSLSWVPAFLAPTLVEEFIKEPMCFARVSRENSIELVLRLVPLGRFLVSGHSYIR